jgi:hypothetical protein
MNDQIPSHLQELHADECWRLVAEQSIGRLVWQSQDGLTAVPVNYAVSEVDGEPVVRLRTAAYSAIARECDDSPVAFQVDELDTHAHSGWSVLLRGHASLAFADEAELDEVEPWPAGVRPVHLTLTPHLVTGRRLGGIL